MWTALISVSQCYLDIKSLTVPAWTATSFSDSAGQLKPIYFFSFQWDAHTLHTHYQTSHLYQCRWATPLQREQACSQPSLDRCPPGTTPTVNTRTAHSDRSARSLKCWLALFISPRVWGLCECARPPCGVRSWREARWGSWWSPACRTWTPHRNSHPDLSLASHLRQGTQVRPRFTLEICSSDAQLHETIIIASFFFTFLTTCIEYEQKREDWCSLGKSVRTRWTINSEEQWTTLNLYKQKFLKAAEENMKGSFISRNTETQWGKDHTGQYALEILHPLCMSLIWNKLQFLINRTLQRIWKMISPSFITFVLGIDL